MYCKKKLILLLFIIFNLLTFTSSQAQALRNDKPIKIVLNDWTSQLVLSHIAAELFEGMGYSVIFQKKPQVLNGEHYNVV
jgi:glycine betaine/proline transport system substrate-binding protein